MMTPQTTVARTDLANVLRAAYRANPHHPQTARRLARYLFSNDELEELVRELSPSPHNSQLDPECSHFVGMAALTLGENDLAERTLSYAAAAGHRESLGHWAKALWALDRTSEAYSAAMRRLKEFPADDAAGQVLFGMLLTEGRYAELWDLCSRLHAAGGWSARIISAMALAAQTPDQIAFVRRLTDHDAWVEQTSLAPDIGNKLSELLEQMDLWEPLPRTKATLGGGKRIEKLHKVHDASLEGFFEHLQTKVANYTKKRADRFCSANGDHPMAAMRPESFTLASWALAVNMDGHEGWHIHPDGWLSGVFYVEVPDLTQSGARHAGQIEFGPYPLGPAANDSAWPRLTIQPCTGDLLLFPSWFAHRTWPTGVPEDRVCIAFDVLRRGIQIPLETTDAAGGDRFAVNIGDDDRVVRHPCAVSATKGSVQVVMNAETGRYLTITESGAILWELLKEPITAQGLIDSFVREFEGEAGEIGKDIKDLLNTMVSQGLVVVV